MPEALTVQVVEFTAPMVLASPGFLATLEGVEQQVSALIITDAITAQQAADLQSRLTTAGKTLDTQRKALNKPFDDQITAINAAAKGPANRIEAAKLTVSRALTAFAVAEAQRVQMENRKRQAELAALQEQQRKEKAEADRIAAEAAKVSPDVIEEDWGTPSAPVAVAPTETEKKIAAIAVPVAPMARPVGVSLRTTLKAIVVDLNKVPPMFVERSIKMRAIESTYCVKFKAGDPIPEVPGLRFEIETRTVSTGR